MKIGHLLIPCALLVTSLSSCSKKNEPFDQTSINTVYWQIQSLPASTPSSGLTLVGEVGNNRDVDSLSVVLKDATTGAILKSKTLKKADLSLESRKDFPSSTIKWYKISYKPSISIPAGDEVFFTLVAHTPFGDSQDLRAQSTGTTTID